MKGWESKRRRWSRMYRGVRFKRTPAQLGLAPEDWTEERSAAAFQYWFLNAVQQYEQTGMVPEDRIAKPRKPRTKRVPDRDYQALKNRRILHDDDPLQKEVTFLSLVLWDKILAAVGIERRFRQLLKDKIKSTLNENISWREKAALLSEVAKELDAMIGEYDDWPE